MWSDMDVEIDYTNHRGERRKRSIRPIKLTWGLSEWHEGSQWILLAHCFEKNAPREFAMASIHSWRQAPDKSTPGLNWELSQETIDQISEIDLHIQR